MSLGAGTTSGSYTEDSMGLIYFDESNACQVFSAPGTGNTGSFDADVSLLAYPWLRYDWELRRRFY